jgi:hypothetical protein
LQVATTGTRLLNRRTESTIARFVVECHYPTGPRRVVHVTSEAMPRLAGAILRHGTEIEFRGRRWDVTLVTDADTDRWVLTPAGTAGA